MRREEATVGDCVQLVDVPGRAGVYAQVVTPPMLFQAGWRLGVRLLPDATTGYLPLDKLRWVGGVNIVRSVLLQQTGRDSWATVQLGVAATELLTGAALDVVTCNAAPGCRPASKATLPKVQPGAGRKQLSEARKPLRELQRKKAVERRQMQTRKLKTTKEQP